MIRKPSNMGIALLLALAVSAIAAPPATAAKFFVASEQEHTVISGAQLGTASFSFDAGKVECKGLTYSGTTSLSLVTEMTVSPQLKECEAAFGKEVAVGMNGCSYRLYATTIEGATYSGKMDIECPEGKKIEIETLGCTVTLPAQSALSSLTFSNEGKETTREVIVSFNVSGLKYEEHKGKLSNTCKNETSLKSNGTLSATTSIGGRDTQENHVGIWLEQQDELHSEATHTTINGVPHPKAIEFAFDAGAVLCEELQYEGTAKAATKTATEITVNPQFEECHLTSGGTEYPVLVLTPCSFVLHVEKTNGDGSVAIECPEEKSLSVFTTNCTITIPSQNALQSATFTNRGSGATREVTVDFSLGGIEYIEHKSGPTSPCKEGTETKENGSYSGIGTISGEDEGAKQVGIWVESAKFQFEKEHSIFTGGDEVSEHTFSFDAGNMECEETPAFATVQSKTATEFVAVPTYKKCFLSTTGGAIVIDFNNCSYVFHFEGSLEGSMDVACPIGKTIVFTLASGLCTITIPPQAALKRVRFTNKGAGSSRQITVDIGLANLQYEEHRPFGTPPCKNSTALTSSGLYTGQITLAGTDTEGKPVGIWVE